MKIIKLKRKVIEHLPDAVKLPDDLAQLKRAQEIQRRQEKELFAQSLRDNPTDSEKLFCEMLGRLNIHFVFQPIMYGFIPDFYFPRHGRKIIEVDGASHKGRAKQDRRRDAVFINNNHKILHITANRMFWDLASVEIEVKGFLSGIAVSQKRLRNAKKKRTKRLPPDPLLKEFFERTKGI